MNVQKLITPNGTVTPRPLSFSAEEKGDNSILRQMLPYWQNNSSTYSGFLKWAWDFFSVRLDNYEKESTKLLIQDYHVPDWWETAIHMIMRYYPGMRKVNRANAIATYRDGAKTSLLQLIMAYFTYIGKYGIYWENNLLPRVKFTRYRSKNFGEASKKMDTLKLLMEDADIIKVFGSRKPSYSDKLKGISKDNIHILITNEHEIFLPFGIEQSARGHNILGRRPDLDIADDVETTGNTKTAKSREYIWEEIMAEQFGGLKDDGMFVFIFNYVHPQGAGATIVESVKKNVTSNWNILVRKLSYDSYDANGNKIIIPDWPERYNVNYIKGLEEFYKIKQRDYSIFRREFYNEFIADEEYIVNEYEGRYIRREGINWLELIRPDGSTVLVPHKFYVSVDPAISEDKRSSDAVIAVTAVAPDGKRRVHELKVGKYDNRDRYLDDAKRPPVIALTEEEMTGIRRKGLVEETVRTIIKYNADLWIIERAGQQLAWYNDVIDILRRLGLGFSGTTYHPTDEKVYKIKSGLLSKMAAGMYEINKYLLYKTRLISALKSFPNELDIFDALHNVEPFITVPKDLSIQHGQVVNKEKKDKSNKLPPALANPERYIGQVETFLFF